MDSGQVEVENPTQPDSLVIVNLLILPVVPNPEVVCNVEKVLLILGKQNFFDLGAKVLQNIG